MTLHQLKIFQVVSHHRNITKASKVLRISQPSVFKQVKSLEESYKTKLYKKIGRGIELTEQGQLFQREVEEILRRVDRLEKNFGLRSPSPSAARLLIGASHGPSASLIPSLLANFKKTHPLVQVTLRTRDSLGIERLLAESDGIEIGVVTNLSRMADLRPASHRAMSPRADFVFCFHQARAGQEKDAELGRIGATAFNRQAEKPVQNSGASQTDRAARF